jgi:hypothetical protein
MATGGNIIHRSVTYGSFTMNKDQVKGTAEKVKGKINETVGRATGNTKQEVKGDIQQTARPERSLATPSKPSKSPE